MIESAKDFIILWKATKSDKNAMAKIENYEASIEV